MASLILYINLLFENARRESIISVYGVTNTKFKRLNLDTVLFIIKVYLFQFFNFYKYKNLGKRAYIINPLRLDGTKYMSIGNNVIVQKLSWLIALKIDDHEPELVFGDGCSIGYFNHIASVRKVVLGKNVMTANGVYISDNLHGFDDLNTPISDQPVSFCGDVHIGEGSWIGENACKIGANIEKNSELAANSELNKDVPDYSVVSGSPARIIKKLVS